MLTNDQLFTMAGGKKVNDLPVVKEYVEQSVEPNKSAIRHLDDTMCGAAAEIVKAVTNFLQQNRNIEDNSMQRAA